MARASPHHPHPSSIRYHRYNVEWAVGLGTESPPTAHKNVVSELVSRALPDTRCEDEKEREREGKCKLGLGACPSLSLSFSSSHLVITKD